MNVKSAVVGRLTGQYFSNRWLYGETTFARQDNTVDFIWSKNDPITPTGNDFVSVRWLGYLKPSFSEVYTFIVRVNDGVKLWIGGDILIDEYHRDVDEGEQYLEFTVDTTEPL